jgi:hypothetical protein
VAFEYKTKVNDKEVVLKFKPYGDAPGRISRHNIGQMEAQVWAYLEWGLIEPKNWPVDGNRPGYEVFDVLPQREITEIYRLWQSSDDDE